MVDIGNPLWKKWIRTLRVEKRYRQKSCELFGKLSVELQPIGQTLGKIREINELDKKVKDIQKERQKIERILLKDLKSPLQ
ncbi:hypothetical protein ACFLXO_05215 [Chloroflexota bacterium]